MAKRKRNQRGRRKEEETLVNVIEVRDQAQGFLEKNQTIIIGALAAVLLLIGGVFAYNNFYKAPRQQEAIEQMFQAEFQFQRDSFAQSLTNPGGGYKGFLDIIDEYGGTATGNLANYYAGICYLNLGQYDAAISYLEDYTPAGAVTPSMKYGALGDAYSEKSDFDKAMSLYKKAAKAEDNDLITPYYLKKVGMLHEHQGNSSEALKAYNEIKAKYPNTTIARDIEKYIAKINTQG